MNQPVPDQLTEGDRDVCGWPECGQAIYVKRNVHVEGDDTLDWVHDVPTAQKVCPGWQPKAKPGK